MSTAIWINEQDQWKQLQPAGFKDEGALHDLVENAPHLLPLSGSPQLAVVGREVRLGSGYADLVAVESSGRLVILEIKLAYNAEARRAVVAQILAYAAYLHRIDHESLERDILGTHLINRGYKSLLEAVVAAAQGPPTDTSAFERSLQENLDSGRFRLVLVLDSIPQELVQLVGYLGVIAPELTLDLVAVSAFDIQGTTALVPQRVDPEQIDVASPAPKPKPTGQMLDGGEAFAAWIQHEPEEQRAVSETIYKWARDLEDRNLVRLRCAQSPDVTTLIVIPRLHDASMASAWKGRLYLYRSVFERLAPESISAVESAVAPNRLGQGTVAPQVDTELLSALTVAYEEAATTS